LGLQWNRDRFWKERTGRRRAEMKRKGLRMAPEKVRRRGLCHLSSVRIVVLLIEFFIFCDLNV